MGKKSKHIGKIGWCDKDVLGLPKGHYVFIRRVKNDKCDVNTFTSLERNNGRFKLDKINYIRNGSIYPIPKNDVTLSKFSGVDKRIIKDIPISKIQDKGCYTLKRRHHHYIQKYVK